MQRRAGSTFVGQSDSQRRPYRRRQRQVAPPERFDDDEFVENIDDTEFDYRLDEPTEDFDVSQVGFCSGDSECYCGDCVDSCCGGGCEPSCGIDGGFCGTYGPCCPDYYPTWFLGFEWSFVKPRFSDNVAFTTMESNGTDSFNFSDTEFDYDLELSPRLWLEGTFNDAWGWRVTYWQFDQSPATATTSPPANGAGLIDHPTFGDIDISSTVPTDTYTAASDLNVYTIDFEALKYARINRWQLGLGAGMRYASTEQGYLATLNDGATDIGSIDFTHDLEGFGPTFSAYGSRPLLHRINLVGAARASVLFGDSSSRLSATEPTLSTTTRVTNRDDLLPIGEARLGLEWLSTKHPRGWQWMLTTAMEGQIWGNAGNASNETADLGFFGFNFGAGVMR